MTNGRIRLLSTSGRVVPELFTHQAFHWWEPVHKALRHMIGLSSPLKSDSQLFRFSQNPLAFALVAPLTKHQSDAETTTVVVQLPLRYGYTYGISEEPVVASEDWTIDWVCKNRIHRRPMKERDVSSLAKNGCGFEVAAPF